MLLNPKKLNWEFRDDRSREIMEKTVAFFEGKGLAKVKEDDHERVWYKDFIEFLASENIFATLLTPSSYASLPESRWDTWRNCAFNEITGFYGLAYWYTWQVSILGLGPIWMSHNEEMKSKTAELLAKGGIFAFGLSEKEHGADLYSSEMTLKRKNNGTYVANGRKYYIGNANEAALISTFGVFDELKKDRGKEKYVFFAVDPSRDGYTCLQNVVNSQNYVAEFELTDYVVHEKELLAQGRDAWDMSLNTVNVGKFNLGWASIGMCTHAFYEALDHASNRRLFSRYVTDFTHIKQYFVDAYLRLLSMKLFALRAIDYMRTASREDRRYLLYNPMVKMKVTTQGEEVIDLLWDIIAAKGFEKDVYFEMAARDIRALPKLEGTVHVNMALIIKFMKNYFFNPRSFPKVEKMNHAIDDLFLFNQGPTKGLGKIQFHDYRPVYASVDIPNVRLFSKQIQMLKTFLMLAKPSKAQAEDFDFLLNLGELFTLVVYGQLIIENAQIYRLDHDVLDQIFDVLIRDFSKYALKLSLKTSSTTLQRLILGRMIRKPVPAPHKFNAIWSNHIQPLKGAYTMNP